MQSMITSSFFFEHSSLCVYVYYVPNLNWLIRIHAYKLRELILFSVLMYRVACFSLMTLMILSRVSILQNKKHCVSFKRENPILLA